MQLFPKNKEKKKRKEKIIIICDKFIKEGFYITELLTLISFFHKEKFIMLHHLTSKKAM